MMALMVTVQVKKGVWVDKGTGSAIRFDNSLAAWMALEAWIWRELMGLTYSLGRVQAVVS